MRIRRMTRVRTGRARVEGVEAVTALTLAPGGSAASNASAMRAIVSTASPLLAHPYASFASYLPDSRGGARVGGVNSLVYNH